jgi:hypothetical protein
MAHRLRPWWLGYLLASPVRRLFQSRLSVVSEPVIRSSRTALLRKHEPMFNCGGSETFFITRLGSWAFRVPR